MDEKIKKMMAREILDSRGNPTLAVDVFVGNVSSAGGAVFAGSFAVPAGASTGSHEALERRDGDKSHFNGQGVTAAIENINKLIGPTLVGFDVCDQKAIDAKLLELDATGDKSNLGSNSMIGASVACAKAAAAVKKVEVFEHLRTLESIKPSRSVPMLFMNLINGGKHAQTSLAFQEYHIVPQTEDIEESLNIAEKIELSLKNILVEKFGPTSANLGDEGGFVPDVSDVEKPVEILFDVLEKNKLLDRVKISLDVAASSFYTKSEYTIGKRKYQPADLMEIYKGLIKKYGIFSIEDPFFENDFESFARLKEETGIYIVGDDLTVTNSKRLQKAIDKKSINSIIIKPNQIGTLSETLQTMKLARENNIECIVSHRSGETNDDFIADLAWAFGCFGLKAGAPQRGERVAKYNRLWEIQRRNGVL